MALELERLRSLLEEWLEVERSRDAFRIAALEESVTLELSQLSVVLRVDRIDELPGGERVIIDYKTGESQVRHWLGERPHSRRCCFTDSQALNPRRVSRLHK